MRNQERTLNRSIVFITGASSGIGAACAERFAGEGAALLLAARRRERLQAMEPALRKNGARDVHLLGLDVRDREAVRSSLSALPERWRSIDVLVNNAGLSRGLDPLHQGDPEDWEEMIETNVKGLLHIDRAVVPGMVERGSGTVIHIGSIAGRQVYPGGNVYCATKHAVKALTEGLRIDLLGTGVRVVSVDPGLVETEFSKVRFHGNEEKAKAAYAGMTPLTGADVADAVVFAATRPPHVQVAEILLLPADQAAATFVHRNAGPS